MNDVPDCDEPWYAPPPKENDGVGSFDEDVEGVEVGTLCTSGRGDTSEAQPESSDDHTALVDRSRHRSTTRDAKSF
jgi:hypothetical protein